MRGLEKLKGAIRANNSLVCVGLDSDVKKIPKHLRKKKDPLYLFNQEIIDATKGLVCAYKINSAFYEALGAAGMETLRKTIKCIPKKVFSILDAKRGDIGNTAEKYAQAAFDYFKADAVTLSPYLGFDSIQPFAEYQDKLSFILCLTSNPSAGDLQFLKPDAKPLFLHLAAKVKNWNKHGNLGLVVGATYPAQIREIRKEAPLLPFLIPGLGAQGGDLESAVKFGCQDKSIAVFNSSREIIYASSEKDFAEVARAKTIELKERINQVRKGL